MPAATRATATIVPATAPPAGDPPPRIVIERPSPLLDGGRHPARACVGDRVEISADVFRDGHELLRARACWRGPGERRWHASELRPVDAHLDGVRWAGEIGPLAALGRHEVRIEAWTDRFASWRHELERKARAAQPDLGGELSEGALLLDEAAERARAAADRRTIATTAELLRDGERAQRERVAAALAETLAAAVERHPERHDLTRGADTLPIEVDRPRARFGAWYELFPRSWGGFAGVERVLPRLAELGFDVVYLPPIHPIGMTNRKGPNNALAAAPGDPGSPWAIGRAGAGGHTAIDPDLGTLEDFERLLARARAHDLEIALDFAIQCSADHPWLSEHPEWFHHRPDGTLKYAENPPKHYQDIYNVNWESEDWRGLWQALLEVVLFWVAHGVRIFRVDNPHTKPLPFWEWLIAEVRAREPETIFLAEAFTRRAMMQALAKVGFNQSYTYFTWKNGRHDLSEYVSELARSEERHYFRPNFFVNTPDILHRYLAEGGRPAFEARLVLAATLSPSYGVYSGFEALERVPVHPDSEEYLDSEKYELKTRALEGPLVGLIGRLNAIRRAHPAFHRHDNVTFLETRNDGLIAYAKRSGEDVVIAAVNLDAEQANEGSVVVPAAFGLPPAFAVEDMLDGRRYDWRIGPNYVRLAPGERQAHVLRVVG